MPGTERPGAAAVADWQPIAWRRVPWLVVLAYLDHAASGPAAPGRRRGHAALADRAVRQSVRRPPGGSGGAPGRRGRGAGRGGRRRSGWTPEASPSPRAGPRRTTWPCWVRWRPRPGPVVVSAVEHPAVLEAAAASGQEVRVAPVEPDGLVDLDALRLLLDRQVALVSVQLANNETGVIQPLADVARLVRRLAPARRACTPTPCRPRLAGPGRRGRRAPTWSRSAATSSAGRRASAPWPARGQPALARRPARRGPGAGVAQRHPQRGRHRRAGRRRRRRARRPGSSAAARVQALRDRPGRPAASGHPRRRRDGRRRAADARANCTCASPASRARRCSCCSTRPACAPRPARPAPAGPWSPARSCWPWAFPRRRPFPACA